jgi:predicted dehydrogenase
LADPSVTGPKEGPVKLAVLGCGAAPEFLHLPAARELDGLEVSLLVDRDLPRAKALAGRFGIPKVRDTFEGIAPEADAVLIALPNRLHAPISIDLLSRGVAVLVEKPMALSADEAGAMVDAAAAGNAVLQVALTKRFARGARLIKKTIDEGLLGSLTGFSIEWGEDFSWPFTTDSAMSLTESGGGVLIDFGSHLLDLLCWWLGAPESVAYADDTRGGVEADCVLSLTLLGPAGRVSGEARFSRIRTLRNTVLISGDRLTIEWAHERPDAIRIWPTSWKGDRPNFTCEVESRQSFEDLFVEQLRSFVATLSDGGPSPVSGESVLPSVKLIERCYRERRTIAEPWDQPVVVPRRVVP